MSDNVGFAGQIGPEHVGQVVEKGFKSIIIGNILRNIKAIISASLTLGIPIVSPENRVTHFPTNF